AGSHQPHRQGNARSLYSHLSPNARRCFRGQLEIFPWRYSGVQQLRAPIPRRRLYIEHSRVPHAWQFRVSWARARAHPPLHAHPPRRFTRTLPFKAAYTWSHNTDDSTADLFSTLLSPRRPQDFQNMSAEKAASFLDRRHRLTYTWVYELPGYSKSDNRFLRYT